MDHDAGYAPQSPPLRAENADGDEVLVVGWVLDGSRHESIATSGSLFYDRRALAGLVPVTVVLDGPTRPVADPRPLRYSTPSATDAR